MTLPLALAIALGFGGLGALWLFGRALALFVLAVTLASAIAPLVPRPTRHLTHGMGVVLVYLTFALGLAAIGVFTVPAMSGDLARFTQTAPELLDRIRQAVSDVLPLGGDAIGSTLQNVVPQLVSASSQLANAAVDVLVVVFLSMYLLMAAPAFDTYVCQLVPRHRRRRTRWLLGRISREMGGYFRGSALNGVVVAGLTWGALALVGLDYAGPLAIIAFFGELVPYLGPVIAAIPAVAIALLESPGTALTVVLVYAAIQQIEGHVLTPVIMHSQTHISPALVIIALATGYSIGGMLGALTAIPVFAAGRVIVRHVVAPELRRRARASTREHEASGA